MEITMPYMKKLMNEPVGIGIVLRAYREEHNLSQDELGDLCSLTGSAISRMESGQRTRFEVDTLLRLTQVMSITLDELVAQSTAEVATA